MSAREDVTRGARELPFHEALRAAIDARGLPLERVSAHLRGHGHTVSIGTLSYWQSGRSVPSRATSLRALGAVETILRVERGHLAQRVPVGRSRRRVSRPARMADGETRAAVIEELMAELGATFDDGLRLVSAHARSFVASDLSIRYVQVREVFWATRPQVARYLVAAWHPVPDQEVVITPVHGCALNRCVGRLAESVCVAELAIPPLAQGGTHALDYEIAFLSDRPGASTDAAVAFTTAPISELCLEVNFAPGRLPDIVRLVEGASAEAAQSTTVPKIQQVMTVTRLHFGPGKVGLEWDVPLP